MAAGEEKFRFVGREESRRQFLRQAGEDEDEDDLSHSDGHAADLPSRTCSSQRAAKALVWSGEGEGGGGPSRGGRRGEGRTAAARVEA